MSTKHLIRERARWRVGLGAGIGIWGEPWLPDADNPYMLLPPPMGLEKACENPGKVK